MTAGISDGLKLSVDSLVVRTAKIYTIETRRLT